MLPSPLTILAGVVVAFLVILVVVRGPVDADYWWHLATGRLILESGSVPTVDPYSFAYSGPWVAHEWLGEVLIAVLVDSVGYPITAGIFGVAVSAVLLVPAVGIARDGMGVRALLPWIAIGTYTLASYATVRPQVLSWVFVAGLLVLLIKMRPDHRVRPWLVPPIMLLWANVHGLWVIGLAMIGVYAVFTLLGRTPMRARRLATVGMLIASGLACAFTPSGVAGLLYPLRYLRQDDWGTAFIAEWQAADFTDPRQVGIAILLVGFLLLGRRGTPVWLVALGAAGLLAALLAVRNAPIAVILTLPVLANGLQARLGEQPVLAATRARQRRLLEIGAAAAVVAGMVIVVPSVARGDERTVFPAAAFDALAARDPDARLLVDYDWGGYAIHRLREGGGQVFIDGRSDMYPRQIFEDYLVLRAAEPGWEELSDRYGVEGILLPPAAPLIDEARGHDWCPAHEDDRSVLLLRCS
ncbi:MAG: hypothetical protein M3406_03020 [Chloroflexota bacterium]|nr:hypothetical protein [Chloroflexota bacterium]